MCSSMPKIMHKWAYSGKLIFWTDIYSWGYFRLSSWFYSVCREQVLQIACWRGHLVYSKANLHEGRGKTSRAQDFGRVETCHKHCSTPTHCASVSIISAMIHGFILLLLFQVLDRGQWQENRGQVRRTMTFLLDCIHPFLLWHMLVDLNMPQTTLLSLLTSPGDVVNQMTIRNGKIVSILHMATFMEWMMAGVPIFCVIYVKQDLSSMVYVWFRLLWMSKEKCSIPLKSAPATAHMASSGYRTSAISSSPRLQATTVAKGYAKGRMQQFWNPGLTTILNC